MKTRQLTGLIEREGDGYMALCPELDIASQGDNVEEARRNLIEAVELFFETADPAEVDSRTSQRGVRHPARGRRWVGSASSPGARSAASSRTKAFGKYGVAEASS